MNNEFDGLISAASGRYSVPFTWIKAVIGTESNFDPQAYRAEPRINDASYGLMQLLAGTARGLGYSGSINGLYDPATNINLGTKLLADLRGRYGADFRRVYSAYNSGSPDRWETSDQVRHNVERAEEWLLSVLEEYPAAAAGGFGLVVAIGVGLWFYFRKG